MSIFDEAQLFWQTPEIKKQKKCRWFFHGYLTSPGFSTGRGHRADCYTCTDCGSCLILARSFFYHSLDSTLSTSTTLLNFRRGVILFWSLFRWWGLDSVHQNSISSTGTKWELTVETNRRPDGRTSHFTAVAVRKEIKKDVPHGKEKFDRHVAKENHILGAVCNRRLTKREGTDSTPIMKLLW